MEKDYPRTSIGHIDDVISDVEALTRLHEVRNRCARPDSDFDGCLGAILDTAISITGASKGTLQLLDPACGDLMIRVQRGFPQPVLDSLPQRDGETAAVHSTPLISSSERVYGVISTHFDSPMHLGERKRQLLDMLARQAATYLERKRTQQLLKGLTGDVDMLVTECTTDQRYLYVNEPYADFFGRPVELIVGRSMPSVIGEAAFQVIRPYVDRVLAGEPVEFETDVPYAKAGLRRVHAIYIPGFDLEGTVCGWMATINEITDRRDASASRKTSRRRHARDAWTQACRPTLCRR